jgi:hypothetical protein
MNSNLPVSNNKNEPLARSYLVLKDYAGVQPGVVQAPQACPAENPE